MAEIKTKQTEADVSDFIVNFANTEQKKKDSFALVKLLQQITGFAPKMWGPSIIGFGQYHYKSERSKQEGDWPLLGFSPRKAAISLYIYTGGPDQEALVAQLGKIKMGKGCIYIKKLDDIDIEIFKKIALSSINFLQKKYQI